MIGRLGRVAVALGGLGAVGLVVVSANAYLTQPAPVATTPTASVQAEAQYILNTRASLLSNATRLALGMLARGQRTLTPGNPQAKDTVARGRPQESAAAQSSAAPMSDAATGSIPANVRVNNPAEDSHEPDQTTQSETTIAVSGSHVAVGFNDSQNALTAEVAGDDLAGYAYSDNGGQTFTDGGPLPNAPGFINFGDPWMATDANGAMYYSNLALSIFTGNLEVAVAKSTDGGHTWAAPVIASTTNSLFYSADKDALAAGTGPGHSGGALYAAWDDFSFSPPQPSGPPSPSSGGGPGAGGPVYGLAVSHSYDGGQTWQLRYADRLSNFTGCSFSQYTGADPLVDDSTGNLYLVAERIDVSQPNCSQPPTVTFSERFFESTDGGNTFSKGIVVATVNPVPSPFVLGPTSAMRDAEFPTMALLRGTINVAWNDSGTQNGSTQIRLARSSNGGKTWSSAFVTSGAGQRIQPSMSADTSGLHLLYYRINPNLTLDVIAADSSNGVAWSWHQVNSVSFPGVENNPQFDPFIADTYMGDYIANVSDGSQRYYAWGDNRDIVTDFLWPQGRHDPDVFFAR